MIPYRKANEEGNLTRDIIIKVHVLKYASFLYLDTYKYHMPLINIFKSPPPPPQPPQKKYYWAPFNTSTLMHARYRGPFSRTGSILMYAPSFREKKKCLQRRFSSTFFSPLISSPSYLTRYSSTAAE